MNFMDAFPTLTQPAFYRIRIVGRVRNGWSDFLTSLQQTVSKSSGISVTELTGIVADQPALFGLLSHIRDLGVPLISIEFIENILENKPNPSNPLP